MFIPEEFGKQGVMAVELAESQYTGDTDWHEVLRLEMNGCLASRYRVGWFTAYKYSTTSSFFEVRVTLDDVEYLLRSKLGVLHPDCWDSLCGFAYFDCSDGGNHYISMAMKLGNAGDTGYVRKVRLESWLAPPIT